eukprot:Skav207330  [mRNA]  locus=scaffold3027:269477:272816:- [translate_table: standard]
MAVGRSDGRICEWLPVEGKFAGDLLSSWEFRATMLFLVVCCLEISDLIFAVDSVSAIVAQVNDLFLAYSSAVFAMLGLRATFFIIDVLVHMFELLKYGVSAVLIFIGVKLILAHHYTIEPHIVVFVLIGCIGASMVASVLKANLAIRRDFLHVSTRVPSSVTTSKSLKARNVNVSGKSL